MLNTFSPQKKEASHFPLKKEKSRQDGFII